MKNKIWLGVGVGSFLLVLVAIGSGFWYYNGHKEKVSLGAASENVATDTQQQSSIGGSSASGQTLGVSSQSSSAKNLGQISQTGGITNSTLGGSTPT